ncbi:MAG: DUF4238 domain-containing protein [Oceanospirillaceae bacterium]
MKKRRHHYVWRYYLKAWAIDNQIWCLRDGKIFRTNPMNIAQQRDFYKVKILTPENVQYIRGFMIDGANDGLKPILEDTLEFFNPVETYRADAKEKGCDSPDFETALDEAEHNFEEEWHSILESNAIEHLGSILNQDISFYSNESHRMNFCIFLADQYTRTNKLKQNILVLMQDPMIENCWGVIRNLLTITMGFSLFSNIEKYKLIIVVNDTTTKFITGDQPVLNTYVADDFGKTRTNNVEFYYPVSSSLAILISDKKGYQNQSEERVSEEQVIKFNKMIFQCSHEQIYAKTKDELEVFHSSEH